MWLYTVDGEKKINFTSISRCTPHLQSNSSDVMAKVLDCDHKVSRFELQLRYYVHFRTNNVGKRMNPWSPSSRWSNVTAVLLQWWLKQRNQEEPTKFFPFSRGKRSFKFSTIRNFMFNCRECILLASHVTAF